MPMVLIVAFCVVGVVSVGSVVFCAFMGSCCIEALVKDDGFWFGAVSFIPAVFSESATPIGKPFNFIVGPAVFIAFIGKCTNVWEYTVIPSNMRLWKWKKHISAPLRTNATINMDLILR